MNKELIEKVSAMREDLISLTQVTDVKKLADLVKQKTPVIWPNYLKLIPYMTVEQQSRANCGWVSLEGLTNVYLERGEDHLTDAVTRFVPQMIADLDAIAKKLEQG